MLCLILHVHFVHWIHIEQIVDTKSEVWVRRRTVHWFLQAGSVSCSVVRACWLGRSCGGHAGHGWGYPVWFSISWLWANLVRDGSLQRPRLSGSGRRHSFQEILQRHPYKFKGLYIKKNEWNQINHRRGRETETRKMFSKNVMLNVTKLLSQYDVEKNDKVLRSITLISSSITTSFRWWRIRSKPIHFNGKFDWSNDLLISHFSCTTSCVLGWWRSG